MTRRLTLALLACAVTACTPAGSTENEIASDAATNVAEPEATNVATASENAAGNIATSVRNESAPTETRPPAASPPPERYTARGQEPGWLLTIANNSIDYAGDYGETKINVPRPDPRTTFNGHRYETKRLTVDVTHGRCNDVMSGQGYADTVMVIADGKTVNGCGGERKPGWDD